ncbi:MAG: hypothetical protein U0235_04130 [Polyangiaceae bacterium]
MKKSTILVIDDEPHIVMGLRDALEFEGFRRVRADRQRRPGPRAPRTPTR